MIRGWWLVVPIGLAVVSALAHDDEPTYSETIQPMLARSCVPCHHPGGESPFPLVTYAEVKKRASLLRWVCIVGTMPPLDASSEVTQYEATHRPTDQDLLDLQEWVRTGMKEGKRSGESKVSELAWHLSKPDYSVHPERPGEIPAEGPPLRKLFVLDCPGLAGKSITGFSLLGSAPLALRHAYLAVVPEGGDPQQVFTLTGVDASKMVGAWAPGHFAWHSKVGVPVPAGAKLAVWALYQPTGKPESADFKLSVSIGATHEGPEWHSLGNKEFAIKPSDGLETLRDEWTLTENRKLTAVVPECKLYAQQVRVSATFPNGITKNVLSVKTWDRNWVGAYNSKEATSLPKGTKVVAEIDYDNSGHSAGNREARPTTSVRFGPTDKDEHFWVHLQTVPDVP